MVFIDVVTVVSPTFFTVSLSMISIICSQTKSENINGKYLN